MNNENLGIDYGAVRAFRRLWEPFEERIATASYIDHRMDDSGDCGHMIYGFYQDIMEHKEMVLTELFREKFGVDNIVHMYEDWMNEQRYRELEGI